MGSSEIVDSGEVTGQKSQFSQTCNLLSQFLKQRGSFGDLNSLGGGSIYRNFEPNGNQTTATTMDLLPMIEKSGESTTEKNYKKPMNLFPQEVVFNKEQQTSSKGVVDYAKSEPEKAQMTIFYGGQVIVFDDFPADKANEIMKLANKQNPTNNFSYNMMMKNQISAVQELPKKCPLPLSQSTTAATTVADLPIARRNSLTRFLEKRKDRLTATAPYQICKKNTTPPPPAAAAAAVSLKQEEDKAWLGLGAQIPVKTEQFFS